MKNQTKNPVETKELIKRSLKNKQGQGMSEYLILMVLICVASITASTTLGKTVIRKLTLVNNKLEHEVTMEATQGNQSNQQHGD